VAKATNATPQELPDLAMATCPYRSKWCTCNDERVLQDNVLPRITRVATMIMSQHQEVVATCAIATPKVWLLYAAASIALPNECGKKDYVATPRSDGNMFNCHTQDLVAIRCRPYCYA